MNNKVIRNTDGLKAHAAKKRKQSFEKVDTAIQALIKAKTRINFNTVSAEAGVSKAYLYNTPTLRNRIDALREQQKSIPPEQKKHNMTESSQDVLIAAKNKRIQELMKENKRLKQEISRFLGKKYEDL